MFGGLIFKLVRKVVEGAIKQIMQQVEVIENLIQEPLKTILSSVIGQHWRGAGADAFVTEITEVFFPMLTGLMNTNNKYAGAIQKSIQRMDQAVSDSLKIIDSELVPEFENIFK